MIIGLLLYDSHNVENPSACKSRRESGGLDHLFRACAGRLALEHWKRFQGLGNELAYPPNDPRSRRLRQELVGKASWTDSETLPGFLSTFATKQVSWDWAVNLAEPGLGQETLSGTRTPSCLFHNLVSHYKRCKKLQVRCT